MIAGIVLALAAATQAPQTTFTKDVAPVLQQHCQVCHRPGAIAPMSLLTYDDARPWARAIKEKVVKREMPPWYIDRNIGITDFKDDPSLSDAEIVTIKKPYILPAHAPANIVNILVDPGFTEDMYVMAVESKPADAQSYKVVHHFTTNLVEDQDEDPIGLFFNEYALGKNGDIFPPNSGRLIKAGSKINFNLHLNPRGEETPVTVQLGFKVFPKGVVPKYVAFTQHMGDAPDLDIPAGQISRHDGYFRLPRPAVVASFQPHMHNRGKAMCMEAIYPDVRADSARPGPARTETLSCVSNYQFGWHITYPYKDEVAPLLPAGTIIHITAWHDNSANNKYNPNPRNWVGYGQRSIDEMSFAWVTLTYLEKNDYEQRVQARAKK